jgi:zinc and cadmium transporter
MRLWLLSLASVITVSLISLIGVLALSLGEERVRRLAAVLVSFAVGGLLGDAFIHLIPETFARPGDTLSRSLLILAGILLFFVVEKLLRHGHEARLLGRRMASTSRPALAAVNLVGDAIHNFIDGVLIGSSYLISTTLGVATTVAVLLHEIPQELGDYGVLIHSGLRVRTALLANLASASVAIVGTVVALLVGAVAGSAVTQHLVPITAGGFVYIAAADLIPELQEDHRVGGMLVQALVISSGIGVMALLTLLE